MIPLGDDNSLRHTTPVVTYLLVALNILVFLLEMAGGERFIVDWAFVPSRFNGAPAANAVTLFTAMFMHGGVGHLAGNMLYLWIFGDNVEDRLGKVKYLAFYLLCGLAATFSQYAVSAASSVPNVGASGAIAGVLGAYLYFFPQGKVNVMVGRSVTQMPALVVIGFWFVLQFVGGVVMAGGARADVGGIAYLAHIGGFVAGLAGAALTHAFERRRG